MRAISLRRVDWTGWGLILLVLASLIAIVVFHGGCVSQGEPFRGNGHNVYPDGDSASPALGGLLSRLSVLSWICLVVGVIGVAASFYGPLKAFIDSKVALIVVGIGIALPILAALIEPLAERRRVVTFDHRGHGASEKLYDSVLYPAAEMAEDARRLLDQETQGVIEAEIRGLCALRFTRRELDYLRGWRFFKSDFVDLLGLFQLDERFIHVERIAGSDREIDITIRGPWLHTILFEVPVLAIVGGATRLAFTDSESAVWRQRLLAARANVREPLRRFGRAYRFVERVDDLLRASGLRQAEPHVLALRIGAIRKVPASKRPHARGHQLAQPLGLFWCQFHFVLCLLFLIAHLIQVRLDRSQLTLLSGKS